jgi:hypothetical protein
VLEHCHELENVVSPFFGAFLSDSILKATKDVGVHVFIHGFTLGYDIIRDNAMVVGTSSKLYQRIPEILFSYYV